MRTKYRRLLQASILGLSVALAPMALAAQDLAIPLVGGLAVHCSDAAGAVVYTRFVDHLSGWAMPVIDPATGRRLIEIDRPATAQKPSIVQLFLYAHECAHHVSGDVLAGRALREVDLDREKNADKVGIRLMRDQLHISGSQANSLAAIVQRDSATFPSYLAGPERATWIRNCYATSNEDCGSGGPHQQDAASPGSASAAVSLAGSQEVFGPVPISESAPPAHRLPLENALPALADASLSGFVFVSYRETSTIDILYNGRNIAAKNIAADKGGQPRFQYTVYSGTDGLAAKSAFETLDKNVTDILQKWQDHTSDNTRNLDQDRSWLMHSTFHRRTGALGQEFDVWLVKHLQAGGGSGDVYFDVYLEALSASKANK